MPETLYDKLWNEHCVLEQPDGQCLIYIDRHLVNEVTSPQAFDGLRMAGRTVHAPASVLATADHNTPTRREAGGIADPLARAQVEALDSNVREFGVQSYFPYGSERQGILHVVGPELGATQPGMTIVCGDSHTSTHGAFGALAFGIGTSDVEHVLATQCLWMRKSKTLLVQVEGALGPAVTAKDLALHVMAALGAGGGTGHVIEYRGTTIDRLSMEARMTLCNMAIEAGARAGLIAVDATTLSYLKGRERSPQGTDWAQASDAWKAYRSDEGAQFDRQVYLDARPLQPMVTWGTSPEMVVPVSGRVPDPADEPNQVRRQAMIKAQAYMDLTPGQAIASIALNKVFIGSCTNARIEDLRQAAEIVRGKAVHPRILQALVVPGSGQVKQQAEREGLDRVFVDAGFEWRAPGCSMCLGMNADHLLPGERCASTSNRNFEGRQGAGGRSHLVSPAMAAAAAINGCFTDISTVHA